MECEDDYALVQEEIEQANRQLEGASAAEMLRWGVNRFFPRLTMATAFGPEGNCIIHLLAEIEPRVRIFNLETGYQFKETLETRERIKERYGIEVEYIRPELTVAEYEAEHGGPLYNSFSDQCCHDRKSIPLRKAVVGYDAWISAIRKDQTQGPGQGFGGAMGREVQPGENQPTPRMDQEGRLELHHQERCSL